MLLLNNFEIMKNLSSKIYTRNSHYHLSDSKRKYVNVSKSDKLDLLQDLIRTLEIKLLQSQNHDDDIISLMIMLDDEEQITSDNSEEQDSYILYLNQLTSMYEEILNEKK